jgi:hypothetical protein
MLRDWGSTTVKRSGFSARSAPRMTAALVPVAPEVYMWLPCMQSAFMCCMLPANMPLRQRKRSRLMRLYRAEMPMSQGRRTVIQYRCPG